MSSTYGLGTCLTLGFYFSIWEDKTNCCLMHECLPSKLLNFDWNTKWAHWPPKDTVCRGRSGYKHWLHLGRIPCPLACGCITKQQTILWLQPSVLNRKRHPSFFFLWPRIIHALQDSHPSCLEALGGCHDELRNPHDGFTASNNSVGKCNSAIFPSHLPDKKNTSEIYLLCPSVEL